VISHMIPSHIALNGAPVVMKMRTGNCQLILIKAVKSCLILCCYPDMLVFVANLWQINLDPYGKWFRE
jgi:hypothetical protein